MHARIRELPPKIGEPSIVGAKIMAPLTDAMRFIDGEAAHTHALQQAHKLAHT